MAVQHDVFIAGERMVAFAEKALFWPAASTLFVADIHLGKDSAMLASGIPIPFGATSETLCRLSRVLESSGAEKLVLLGDLWHAKAGRTDRFYGDFLAWRRFHCQVAIVLIEGNHDAKSGPLSSEANVTQVTEPYPMTPFALCHIPQSNKDGYVLSGHVHPGVVMEGYGRQAIKLPCFWFGRKMAVLPAFGEFTGCAKVSPVDGDQVLVIADGHVYPAPFS